MLCYTILLLLWNMLFTTETDGDYGCGRINKINKKNKNQTKERIAMIKNGYIIWIMSAMYYI